MFTPDTTVYLCNTPLKIDQKNQLTFDNRQEQFEYFQTTVLKVFTDFTYQRKEKYIRVPVDCETLWNLGVNYVIYDNKNFSTRWVYAFITKIEYVNPNTSYIYIKTDVYQTWFLDCEIKPSMIIRETVINDDLFKHTLPENLPTGEQITISETTIGQTLSSESSAEFDENYYCVIFMSEKVKWLSNDIPKIDSFVGGVSNPCYMYATDLGDFKNFMNKVTENGQVSAVVACVAIPRFFCIFHELDTGSGDSATNYLGSPFSASFMITQTYNPPEHYGIDMVGLSDTTIYSTVNGVVVDSRWQDDSDHSAGYGQLVRIKDNATGLYFIFGHLSQRSVSVGENVVKGQKIGVQGNTGNSTGEHLHYQVSEDWNTGTKNPANYGEFSNTLGVQ